jgi:hypothetical protein
MSTYWYVPVCTSTNQVHTKNTVLVQPVRIPDVRYRRCYDIGNPDVVAPNYDIVAISAKTRYRETRYRSTTTILGVPTIQMIVVQPTIQTPSRMLVHCILALRVPDMSVYSGTMVNTGMYSVHPSNTTVRAPIMMFPDVLRAAQPVIIDLGIRVQKSTCQGGTVTT